MSYFLQGYDKAVDIPSGLFFKNLILFHLHHWKWLKEFLLMVFLSGEFLLVWLKMLLLATQSCLDFLPVWCLFQELSILTSNTLQNYWYYLVKQMNNVFIYLLINIFFMRFVLFALLVACALAVSFYSHIGSILYIKMEKKWNFMLILWELKKTRN